MRQIFKTDKGNGGVLEGSTFKVKRLTITEMVKICSVFCGPLIFMQSWWGSTSQHMSRRKFVLVRIQEETV